MKFDTRKQGEKNTREKYGRRLQHHREKKKRFNKNTRKMETQSGAAVLRPNHDDKRHADIF
jgi:hemoglobin-like flavoprotein